MKILLRHLPLILGIAILAVLFYLGIHFGVRRGLTHTTLVFGVRRPLTIQHWIDLFADLPFWTLTAAVLSVGVWYLSLVLRPVNRPGRAGARALWWALFLLPAPAASILACRFVPVASPHTMLNAYLFIVFYPLFFYYLATVFFSPPAYKYSPPTASLLRR